MDVILTSAFGVQANVQMDPNNKYTRHAETIFQMTLSGTFAGTSVNYQIY